jgi:Flp pilus assembly protein TadD
MESLDDPDLTPSDRERIHTEAEADSLHAVELDPNDPYLWLTRGWVLAAVGNVVGAEAAYQKSLDLDSTQVSPLLMRAGLAMRAGDVNEALHRLELVRKAWGSTAVPEVDGMSCMANLRLGAYETAIRDCERARLASDDAELYVVLTAAYALVGDAAKAAQMKERLLQAEPTFTIAKWESMRTERSAKAVERDRAHLVAGLRKAGVPE